MIFAFDVRHLSSGTMPDAGSFRRSFAFCSGDFGAALIERRRDATAGEAKGAEASDRPWNLELRGSPKHARVEADAAVATRVQAACSLGAP